VSQGSTPWPLSRWIASGLGAVVVFSVIGVALLRASGFDPAQDNTSPVVASSELRFVDAEKGEVLVYEHPGDRLLARLPPAEESFVRGVLRSMARERRSRDISPDSPFRLSKHRDGSLILSDPAVGREINLVAFGPTNVGSFEKLLAASQSGS
jgi:putative photosynthetic complex assembly protein